MQVQSRWGGTVAELPLLLPCRPPVLLRRRLDRRPEPCRGPGCRHAPLAPLQRDCCKPGHPRLDRRHDGHHLRVRAGSADTAPDMEERYPPRAVGWLVSGRRRRGAEIWVAAAAGGSEAEGKMGRYLKVDASCLMPLATSGTSGSLQTAAQAASKAWTPWLPPCGPCPRLPGRQSQLLSTVSCAGVCASHSCCQYCWSPSHS